MFEESIFDSIFTMKFFTIISDIKHIGNEQNLMYGISMINGAIFQRNAAISRKQLLLKPQPWIYLKHSPFNNFIFQTSLDINFLASSLKIHFD